MVWGEGERKNGRGYVMVTSGNTFMLDILNLYLAVRDNCGVSSSYK